jgi:diguanylate cyclase (GGDEF)-like protein
VTECGRVTVSVGVAVVTPHAERRAGDLIEAADAALYAAKHRGRNQVVEQDLIERQAPSLAPAL